ncbi:MAG TPA: DUF3592 domain-containing protein [Polyangiaceae bacterium]|nr:DUF3592 domain-containing protein [Polyangiaceae bacterium]
MAGLQGLEVTLSIVGAVALLGGVGVGAWRASMWLSWAKGRATVTAYRHQRAYRGSAYRRITVELVTGDGEKVEATDDGVWNRYAQGQVVTVLLVPGSDPRRVVVPELLRFWMMSLIFIPFGAAFLYAGLVYVPGLG